MSASKLSTSVTPPAASSTRARRGPRSAGSWAAPWRPQEVSVSPSPPPPAAAHGSRFRRCTNPSDSGAGHLPVSGTGTIRRAPREHAARSDPGGALPIPGSVD
jgi:hypothetical protein